MLTTDLALREDPAYEKISRRFHEDPDAFRLAFAKAWYKLLHRDMGPVSRFLGPWVAEPQLWQDPVPAVDHALVDDADVAALKAALLDSGLSVAQLVRPRGRRRRGSAPPTSAAARTAPGCAWSRSAAGRSTTPRSWQRSWGSSSGCRRTSTAAAGQAVSLADVIVLGGTAAVEQAARDAGHDVTVPFTPVAPTPRRRRPTSSRSGCSSRGPTGSATTCGPARRSRPRRCWSTGPTCSVSALPR